MSLQFWPYDEVEFHLKDAKRGLFRISCPWLVSEVEIEPGSLNFQVLSAFAEQGVEILSQHPEYALPLSEVMGALDSLPICYRLPRQETFGMDSHPLRSSLDLSSPQALATSLGLSDARIFEGEWAWDVDSSLELSIHEPDTFDPYTLLSVARRFHYLDCADNKMQQVYDQVSQLEDPARKTEACALIVRQNHYVTEYCERSLQPATQLAFSALPILQSFIQAEKGHDRLLAGSLTALGMKPENCPPTPAVRALMALLQACATHNFLAFCMSLDFFEKPQFRDEDTLSQALVAAGKTAAAKALQIHKNINDTGEHEAMSRELLSMMKPVDREYAIQAVRMAELVSAAIARVPYDIAEVIGE